MPRKVFQCKACGGVHERPINSKCQHSKDIDTSDIDSVSVSGAEQLDID